MGFLNQLKSLFVPQALSKGTDLWLYVKCKHCGTPLAVRVNLMNEPSADYESGGFILIKEMMDSKCFTLMRAEIRFDAQRHIVEQTLDKGDFITQDEYETLTKGK
jgi:hypothetical protein